jgi:hypothetical protein
VLHLGRARPARLAVASRAASRRSSSSRRRTRSGLTRLRRHWDLHDLLLGRPWWSATSSLKCVLLHASSPLLGQLVRGLATAGLPESARSAEPAAARSADCPRSRGPAPRPPLGPPRRRPGSRPQTAGPRAASCLIRRSSDSSTWAPVHAASSASSASGGSTSASAGPGPPSPRDPRTRAPPVPARAPRGPQASCSACRIAAAAAISSAARSRPADSSSAAAAGPRSPRTAAPQSPRRAARPPRGSVRELLADVHEQPTAYGPTCAQQINSAGGDGLDHRLARWKLAGGLDRRRPSQPRIGPTARS